MQKVNRLIVLSILFAMCISFASAQFKGNAYFQKVYDEQVANDKLGQALESTNTQTIGFSHLDEGRIEVSVSLTPSDILLINAKGYPSSGHFWTIASIDEGALQVIEKDQAPSLGVGALVAQRFVLKSLVGGISQVVLHYAQGNNVPLKKAVVTVNSEGAYTGSFNFVKNVVKRVPLKSEDYEVKALPSKFDWRANGGTTPAKGQGATNACWAFGTSSAFESVIKIETGVTRDISEQWLCNCNPYGFTCEGGGWFPAPMMVSDGIVLEADLPFAYASGNCGTYPHHEKATSWAYTDGVADGPSPATYHNSTLAQIKQAVYDHGVVAGNCYVGDGWNLLYTDPNAILFDNTSGGGHIVGIAGWDDSKQALLMKNSWGTGWGDDGYGWVAYNSVNTQLGVISIYFTMDTQPGPPISEFTANPRTIQVGESVSFLDGSGKSPTSWLWTFPGGSPSSSTQKNPTVTYNSAGTFNVTLKTTNQYGSDTETKSGYVFADTYCSATAAAGTGDDFIKNVTLADLNKSSSKEGFANFTTSVAHLDAGSNPYIKVTLDWAFPPNNGVYVWVDWNKNTAFDSNELTTLNNNFFEPTFYSDGNISVPSNASGNYRMRIRNIYLASGPYPYPCGDYYSETEDYTVNVAGAVEDTQKPSTPTGLSVTNTTSSSVSLSWNASTDNVGVTGYNVYRNSTNVGTASGTSYTVSGLSASTSYSFYVRAKDAAGNLSSNSSTVNATTQAQGTDKTVGITQVYGTQTNIVNRRAMSFTMPEDGTIQSISLYHGGGNGQLILGLYSGSSSPGTRLGLTSTVSANSSAGWQTVSLQSPASVSAGTTIWLAWVSDVELPIYYQSGSSPRADAGVGWSSGMPNPFGTSTLSNYSYSVHATYVPGGSSDTQAPSTPTNLTTGSITSSSISLSWNASTDNVGVTGYNVYRNSVNVGTASGTSYTVSGLSENTSYSFYVRAKDAAGNLSSNSNTVNATTTGGTTTGCSTPANFQITNVGTTSASFSWGSVSSAVSYRVRYRKIGASTWSRKTFYSTSGTLTSLSTNTDYEAQVRSNCSSEKSAFTGSLLFTTGSTPPPPPSSDYCEVVHTSPTSYYYISQVQFAAINKTSVLGNASTCYSDYTSTSTSIVRGGSSTLSVSFTPNWNSYVEVWIDWNQDGDFDDSGEQVMNKQTSATATQSITVPSSAVLGATRMRVRMALYTNLTPCNDPWYGETEDYTVNVSPGSSQPLASVNVKLAPNPASDVVNVKLNGAAEATVELVNLSGIIVKKAVVTSSNNTLDVSNLPGGLYHVKVITKEGLIITKLIID